MFTETQLAAALQCPVARAAHWAPHLYAAMTRFGITNRLRAAHFLAQIGHESAGLYRLEENLNYNANRLVEVFPRYFTRETARLYAGEPRRIANRVYGRRMGNVGEDDGWRFRGRCPIHLTGRDNYAASARATGLPLLETPDIAVQPQAGALISAEWWQRNGCIPHSDRDDALAVSRIVNFGSARATGIPNGWPDRKERLVKAKKALGVA